MRLKVWHRLGIVLSVAWVLGGGGCPGLTAPARAP